MAEAIEEGAVEAHPRVHRSRTDVEAALSGRRPERIVCLVPSLSEALCVLGLGDRLIGVTRYCVHPPGAFAALPKLGGTKDAEVAAIVALAPDLVLANQEENTLRIVRQLAEAELDVWVTYPRRVREGASLLAELATLGATPEAIAKHVAPVLAAVEAAEAARERAPAATRPRVFCPIWRDPWMTIARDTYIHDMIELCGGRNVYADADDGGTARRDRRYPIVELDSVIAAQPDVILLPDEPYAFDEADRRRLAESDCPAGRAGRVHLIDGTLVSWYGPRIAEAIRVLASLFADP